MQPWGFLQSPIICTSLSQELPGSASRTHTAPHPPVTHSWLKTALSSPGPQGQSHIVTSCKCLCSLIGLTYCSLRMESVPLFFYFYCSIVDSQCCFSFRCTAKSVGYTYIYFFFIRLFSHVGHYMDIVMYMFQPLNLSPSPSYSFVQQDLEQLLNNC